MLQTVFMVFMAFVALVCAFAVLVVVRDIVREQREDRRNRNNNTNPAPAPVVVQQQECSATETPKEEPVQVEPAPVEEAVVDDSSVRFQAGNVQTLEEKYKALSSKYRRFYDEIARYAEKVPNSKHIKNTRYEEFKLRNTRLVRLLIKRGVVTCEFILPNADFKNYINENKVEVKQSASSMKILDTSAVQNAKDSIDIAVRAFEEEVAHKKQLARERQKAAREAKANAEANANK